MERRSFLKGLVSTVTSSILINADETFNPQKDKKVETDFYEGHKGLEKIESSKDFEYFSNHIKLRDKVFDYTGDNPISINDFMKTISRMYEKENMLYHKIPLHSITPFLIVLDDDYDISHELQQKLFGGSILDLSNNVRYHSCVFLGEGEFDKAYLTEDGKKHRITKNNFLVKPTSKIEIQKFDILTGKWNNIVSKETDFHNKGSSIFAVS